ncbi:MAG: amino acid permease [Spirochaetales bacterium]|nr:amino acid permease [Spirochaetales bacterium]
MNTKVNRAASSRMKLSFGEGVAIIVGCNIGAGVIGAAKNSSAAGWPIYAITLIGICFLTIISMLYVAETSLRTREPLTLSGLTQKYLGKTWGLFLFTVIALYTYGCLVAYAAGSGKILNELFGIPNALGTIIFFIPAVTVIWFGLKTSGASNKIITSGMGLMFITLIIASIASRNFDGANITEAYPEHFLSVIPICIFVFVSQFIVPELARGFSHDKKSAARLPKAIIAGMIISCILLLLVPFAVIGLIPISRIASDPDAGVATLVWGREIGSWAFLFANFVALMGMMTSFWAIGGTYLSNIMDQFKQKEFDMRPRLIGTLAVAIPPFIFAYTSVLGFNTALDLAGALAGLVMGIIPVAILRKSRKTGNKEPEWTINNFFAHPILQIILITVFIYGGISYIFSFIAGL